MSHLRTQSDLLSTSLPESQADANRQNANARLDGLRRGWHVARGGSYRRAEPAFWGKGHAGQELGINPETDKILIKFGYRSCRGVTPV